MRDCKCDGKWRMQLQVQMQVQLTSYSIRADFDQLVNL